MRRLIRAAAPAGIFCLLVCGACLISRGELQASTDAVGVHFNKVDTKIETLNKGTVFYDDNPFTVADMPPEMQGLQYTRHHRLGAETLTLHLPANTTAYLMTDSLNSASKVRKMANSMGWTNIGQVLFTTPDPKKQLAVWTMPPQTVYKIVNGGQEQEIKLALPYEPIVAVAARSLELVQATDTGKKPTPTNTKPQDDTPQPRMVERKLTRDSAAPETRIAKHQNSIKMLYVLIQETGGRLGGASDLIITARPGNPGKDINVSFATPVGPQMETVLDEVVRGFELKYPNIQGVDKIEFSFEDKYDGHEGGSLGTACATLLRSLVEGVDLDPSVGMTGDYSADGKVRAIGGITAKLHGARDAGCTIVAAPMENVDQLIDAMIYDGPGTLVTTQVIGMNTLDDALAIARADRSEKLSGAIKLFGEIQESVKGAPNYLTTPAGVDKLKQVLALEPNHLSAKLLLGRSGNQQRRRLSARASIYYTLTAAAGMADTLNAKKILGAQANGVTSNVTVQQEIKELHRIRPMADTKVQPFIDAWIAFADALNQASAWTADVDNKARAVRDAQAKLDVDQDLAQKMVREGV